ncbi:Hypothetical predicted protein [Cloeon dipterum]|uniref:Nose resistant-to-fluoxetine protein N-terminal domain-containing protein n=1 Tax=Cloeon dipterum TaxID=197152 RepID=A0A8S1BZH7_9INSE|nr:Hypothetical predicted protein [Cloeon dipterum]
MNLVASNLLFILGALLFTPASGNGFGQKLRLQSPEFKESSAECKRQIEIYHAAIEGLELWALQMLDANAKIPPGILRGNVDQLGDFEQCLSVRSPDNQIRGKYCLPEIEFKLAENSSKNYVEILNLAQAKRQVTGNLTDPTFYNVANNIFLIGLCLPDACDEKDAVAALADQVSALIADSPLEAEIILRKGFCRTDDPTHLSTEAISAIVLLVVPTLLSLVCWASETSFAASAEKRLSARVLMSLSLGRCWKLLWSRPEQHDDLGCTNGMRAFFLILLYFLHKSAAMMMMPLTNKLEAFGVMNEKWTLLVKMFWNYVDGFIFLSAVSTAYYAARTIKSGKKLNIPQMYLKRYIRFVVLLLVIAFSYTHLAPLIINGPLWMRYLEFTSTNCQGKIWTLATFTSSFNGFPNNCFDTSNHLTTDLLLYLLAPFLVIALWYQPSRSVNFIFLMCNLVVYYKYHLIQSHNLPVVAHNNYDRKSTIKIANYLLFPAIIRLPTYMIGLCTGCYLQKINCKYNLDRKIFWLGNCIAGLMAFYCVAWHYETGSENYVHHYEKTLVYGLIQPFLWSFVLSWFVFICATGQAGKYIQIIRSFFRRKLFNFRTAEPFLQQLLVCDVHPAKPGLQSSAVACYNLLDRLPPFHHHIFHILRD